MNTAEIYPNYWKSQIVEKTISLLPNRIKRMVLITSTASIAKSMKDENTTVKKLNDLFNLTNHDAAIHFPYRVTGLIWAGKIVYDETVHKTAINPCTENIDRLFQLIPKCMHYASDTEIKMDLKKLFSLDSGII